MKILFVVFVSLILFVHIRAGECVPKTVKQSLKYSDAVFVGKVLDVSEVKSESYQNPTVDFGKLHKIRVKVEEYWKGIETKEVDFLIYLGGSEIDWSFSSIKNGERLLVFAKKGRDTDELYAVPCTGTDKIENAKGDLAQLGKGIKFK